MESIKANEINEIIRAQIEDFDASMTVDEIGTVIKVGDGIAEIYGLEKVMAGELLVIIANQPALGVRLQLQRELSDATGLIGTMLVVLAIGIIVDQAIFATMERRIRRRRGL